MALEVHVAGPALVKIGTGDAGALEDLGYTVNGADIELRGFHGDVPGDEHGGDLGPPIDVQYFGEIAIVRLEFSKFDAAVADKAAARMLSNIANPGSPGTPGTLLFGSTQAFRLLINPTNNPMNFPRAFCRGSIVHNKGTRFTRLSQEWECHADSDGVLYNSTTT